jgi:hypothetical protein
LCLKGRSLLALDRPEEARSALLQARAEAEAIGSRRSLWPVLVALSQLEQSRGDAAQAEEHRRWAREIVEFIAGHISSPELRVSFLNLPQLPSS